MKNKMIETKGVMLMLDNDKKVIIPINDSMFEVSQFNSEKKLNKKYQGNKILCENGIVIQFKHIKITGVYGDSFTQKLFNFMNSTKSIRVELEEVEVSMEKIKRQVIEYLKNDTNLADPFLPQVKNIENMESDIQKADNYQEIFKTFHIPSEEDCLDVMV